MHNLFCRRNVLPTQVRHITPFQINCPNLAYIRDTFVTSFFSFMFYTSLLV